MTLQYLQHDTELKIDGLLLQVITLLVQGALIRYYMVDFVYFISQNKNQGHATAKVDF